MRGFTNSGEGKEDDNTNNLSDTCRRVRCVQNTEIQNRQMSRM